MPESTRERANPRSRFRLLSSSLLVLACACGGGDKTAAGPSAAEAPAEPKAAEAEAPAQAGLKVDKGVDLATKTIKIGALNDESGPAATIGKPYAAAKRMIAAQINAGGSGLLPEGWKVELVEKDHGYNAQKALQAYKQIQDDVLFVITSFGTPNTLPLRPMLEQDQMVALPASLSSQMAAHEHTIPVGPSYEVEAMRAMDFVVEQAEKAGTKKADIKPAIVYQQDDYGQDGLNGWKKAAAHHGVTVVSEQTVTPGQRDFAAINTSLKKAGATHVLMTVLPSATGPLLAGAAQLQYKPTWLGQTPTWIDGFFKPEVIPPKVFETFHWVVGNAYWGEESVPGMKAFLEAYEKHGKNLYAPDYYFLLSYAQGLYGIEIVKRAIEAGDVTRAGLMAMVPKIDGFTGNDILQPISTAKFPYVASTVTRVLKPDFDKKSWTTVAPYAQPAAMGSKAAAGATNAM
jgi:ABC-type branched-subunit amino acid transport system substrate-binding protein